MKCKAMIDLKFAERSQYDLYKRADTHHFYDCYLS